MTNKDLPEKDFMGELRPTALIQFEVEKAIRSHAQMFENKNPDIRVKLKLPKNGTVLSEATSLVLFRIYQETLINVLKHAEANIIQVQLLIIEQHVKLEIWDNGKGFAPPANLLDLAQQGHLGLLAMQERAEAVGGTLEINAKTGMGTSLRVTVPVSPMTRA
jgi:two-component system, NarL family, sensor histidine kinase UhpB